MWPHRHPCQRLLMNHLFLNTSLMSLWNIQNIYMNNGFDILTNNIIRTCISSLALGSGDILVPAMHLCIENWRVFLSKLFYGNLNSFRSTSTARAGGKHVTQKCDVKRQKYFFLSSPFCNQGLHLVLFDNTVLWCYRLRKLAPSTSNSSTQLWMC